MRVDADALLLAPTDLSSFLSCRHRTGLDLAAVRGELPAPFRADPFADILRRLGQEHERCHVESLRARGLHVLDLTGAEDAAGKTVEAMRSGVEVIVQAALEHGGWRGIADVLRRVERPSDLGEWSYEVHDTKLARETRGGTVLQLCAYSDLIARIQGRRPEFFHVVAPGKPEGLPPQERTPGRLAGADPQVCPRQGDLFEPPNDEFQISSFRVDDYAAYYRMVRGRLEELVRSPASAIQDAHYPEPVDACELCRWIERCDARRRSDDHLSLIAHCGRLQRVELVAQGFPTLAAAAAMPVPIAFKPARGSRETFARIGHQARVQLEQRTRRVPIAEPLEVKPGEGLCRLPAPSPGDLFLDLEGARFARDGGREFLFGVCLARSSRLDDGATAATGERYLAWWALDDGEEKRAFEAVVDLIMERWAGDPGMHVYHFNHYEPTAFKKLMGRHVTRGDAMDRLLRAGRFVDLYPIVRQAVRAGVESYSIKRLEQYSRYERRVPLGEERQPLVAVELALESNSPGAITEPVRAAVQGYNEDDCRSTRALRDWLESIRQEWIVRGVEVPRPEELKSPEPTARIAALQQEVAALRAGLLDGLPAEAGSRDHPEHHRWLLAYLIDWHKREENADWWEYFRLQGMADEDLFEERDAIAGLTFVEHLREVVGRHGRLTGSVIDRYTYPPQEVAIGVGDRLHARDVEGLGTVMAHDRLARLIDVKKGRKTATVHPAAVFAGGVFGTEGPQRSVMRLAESAADSCGFQLLRRRLPRLVAGAFAPAAGESAQDFAVRIAIHLDRTALAIQGPPGAGKTYVGARMIRALVAAGKRVGVTALSHKVIRNLLEEVHTQAVAAGEAIALGHKQGDDDEEAPPVESLDEAEALEAIESRRIHVLGGTQWLWSDTDFEDSVDVLFVDEAGQMSLASVLAVSPAAGSLVLLGDPQQLDQPQKASHPDGVGISALRHVLGEADVMPAGKGIFLPTTWRMSPALCRFTSELFYRGELHAEPPLAAQELRGTGAFDGSHLWLVPVEHEGNRNACDEEVEAVARIVSTLCAAESRWVDQHGVEHPLTPSHLRIVAPFNAQVTRLMERPDLAGVPIGTVDKFQGQTAAVVIYSMTTSRPEDAPRGMEFLYSLNRLNVATSRARCAAIIVASPRLFEPECRTPRQMQLANALCRFRELSN